MEEWRDIEGYEGLYKVSSLGRVKSLDRINKHSEGKTRKIKGKILSPRKNKLRYGYLEISLYKNGKEKRFKVHRLVAKAFLTNDNNLPQVNHKNGDKNDNSVSNLEWVTDCENKRHAWKNNLYTGNHIKRKVKCIETGEVFESVTMASKLIPCDKRYLQRHLKKEVKSVKGMNYEYI